MLDKKSSSFHLPCLLGAGTLVLSLALAQSAFAAGPQSEPWTGAFSMANFGDGIIRDAYCDLLDLITNGLGALLAAAVAVVTVITIGLGGKHTSSLVMTVVGIATISTGIGFYFGDFQCSGGLTARTRALSRTSSSASPSQTISTTGFNTTQVETMTRKMLSGSAAAPEAGSTGSAPAGEAEEDPNDPFQGF